MYRRYYSYNDMPRIVNKCENGKLFGRFELDDVILGVIILAILLDDGDDGLLLLALVFVFLAGVN